VDEVDFYLQDLASKFAKIEPSEYYLSYSGGRDSHYLLWFIKEYLRDDQIEVVSSNTYMEHPEILHRMKKYADVVLLPVLKPFEIKERYGSPCFSKNQDMFIDRFQRGIRTENTMRYVNRIEKSKYNLNEIASELTLSGELHRVSNKCCHYLKKEPFQRYEKETGKKPITGVRGAEGIIREAKYTKCFTKKGEFTPIWDLSDELLDGIYKKYDIEIPKIYDHLTRTGCAGCPYGGRIGRAKAKRIEKELSLLPPNKREFIKKYHAESYKVHRVNGGD